MAFPLLELENWHPRPNYGFANGLPPLRRMSNRLGAGQSEENKLATFCSPTCCSQYENLIAGHQNPTKSQARAWGGLPAIMNWIWWLAIAQSSKETRSANTQACLQFGVRPGCNRMWIWAYSMIIGANPTTRICNSSSWFFLDFSENFFSSS